MFAKNALIVIATLAAAANAGAADNPLQPSFYWKDGALVSTSEVERYITANNPLVPSYFSGDSKAWVGAAKISNTTPDPQS
jgi:hypothetical protein